MRQAQRIVTIVLFCATAWRASAQCERWLPSPGEAGTGAVAYSTITWDPDGAGPQQSLLIVAGGFTHAGNIFTNYIVAWDGATWQALGSGTGDYITAMTIYNGKLVVVGGFTTAGGATANRIAQWDGATWSTFGDG